MFLVFTAFEILHAQSPGKNLEISSGVAIPAGDFSNTYWIGARVMMDYSPKRFGKLLHNPKPPVAFVLSGGFSYYIGKKENVSTYPFRYGNYASFQVYGGAMMHPAKNWNIKLVAGPALSYYRNTIRFSIGAEFNSTWYWQHQWGIGPSLGILKESGARPLWIPGIRCVYAF